MLKKLIPITTLIATLTLTLANTATAATPKKPATAASSAPASASSAGDAPAPIPLDVQNYITLLGTFTAIQHHCDTPPTQKQQFQIWLSKVETSLFHAYSLPPFQFRNSLQQAAAKPLNNINCPAFLQQWPTFATSLYTNKLNEQSMLLTPPSPSATPPSNNPASSP